MKTRDFLRVGDPKTLFAAFFYFDLSFMVWVILGPLGVAISKSFHLSAAQKGFMVAVPLLAGSGLRLILGVLVDRFGPKRTGVFAQLLVLGGLALAGLAGLQSYSEVLALALVLGVAGASFAVALPLASRWYPPEHQGLALGIAGAGNSGTVLAALFAPLLAQMFGWRTVLGLACGPLLVALATFVLLAKDPPNRPAPRTLAEYLGVLKAPDAWWLMGLYCVTFGGFSGLASSLTIYFNGDYHLEPAVAGFFTAGCVFAGSLVRPLGGALADRFGGVRTLTAMLVLAALGLLALSFHPPGAPLALAVVVLSMLGLGAGNGAVFQLAPQRFPKEIGVVTGVVGAMGGVGGFYLASSLGVSKELTGAYQGGLLVFAGLAATAACALAARRSGWGAASTALLEPAGA